MTLEVTTLTDQHGTVHAYDYDLLGRRTQDRVTTLGTGVDGAVRRIATTYEVRFSRDGWDQIFQVGLVNNGKQMAMFSSLGELKPAGHGGYAYWLGSPEIELWLGRHPKMPGPPGRARAACCICLRALTASLPAASVATAGLPIWAINPG